MGDEVLALKTDSSLLSALKAATSKRQTSDELLEQRVSFIFGSIKAGNGVTREHIREVLVEQQGRPESS